MITRSWRTCTTRTSFVSTVRTMYLDLGPSRTPLPDSFPKEQVTVLPMASSGAVTFICCRQTAGPLGLVMTHGLLAKECDECYFDASGSKGTKCTLDNNGTFDCCGVGCFNDYCACPTKQGIDMTPISYYPRYTTNYTFDVSAITPSKWAQSPHRVVGFSMASIRTMHGRNRFPCAQVSRPMGDRREPPVTNLGTSRVCLTVTRPTTTMDRGIS